MKWDGPGPGIFFKESSKVFGRYYDYSFETQRVFTKASLIWTLQTLPTYNNANALSNKY